LLLNYDRRSIARYRNVVASANEKIFDINPGVRITMATLISHPAVPLGLAALAGSSRISGRLLLTAMLASMLPDADVIGFYLGIPYDDAYGHRGLTHSLLFALMVGGLGALLARPLGTRRLTAFWLLTLATLSHGLLDALTSGGLGVAFFSPWSNQRFFFPWRPIRVAPLSLSRFLTGRGLLVLRSEFLWIWLPALGLAVSGLAGRWLWRRRQTPL
jgi:inner membrane protein